MIKCGFIGFCSRKVTVILPGHPVIPPEVLGVLVCFFVFGGPTNKFLRRCFGCVNFGRGRKETSFDGIAYPDESLTVTSTPTPSYVTCP